MSQNDNVFHFQLAHSEFERRARAMMAAVDFIWRYQIGHIADNEQVSGVAVGYDGGIYPGVTATQNYRLGRLALCREVCKQGAILFIIPAVELFESIHEFFDMALRQAL